LINNTAFDATKFSQGYPPNMEKYWWNLARNKIIAESLKKYLLKNDPILEVGCGKGIVTNYLKSLGWNIIGIDPGIPSEAKVEERHIMYGKKTSDLSLKNRQNIKVLALFDVIEHVRNPASFLAEHLKVLPCVKRIIVTVPARQELWGNFDDYYGHYRRYSMKQLDNEMMSIGMKPIMKEYFFRLVYLGIYFSKSIKRSRAVVFKAPQASGSEWIHRLFAEVLFWEYIVVPNKLPGSSIIGIYSA
jgi:2-polyprenyl-3-methyl-5-hydroxy-6-metoxy-1,4-benzoquinol methylase